MTSHDDNDDRRKQERGIEQQEGWFSNAPWWMISVGIHAVLILGATLVAIESLIAIEPTETFVNVTGGRPAPIQEI